MLDISADMSKRPMESHVEDQCSEESRMPLSSAQDAEPLEKTGKKPVLKRKFELLSIFAFSTIVISTWMGAFPFLGIALTNGGPAGTIYSFIIVWAGDIACFACLGELASMAPTSGGQYHWVSILAPKSSQKLWSYITGWLTICGWQAACASGVYVNGLLFQGFIELLDFDYQPQAWHAYLLLLACSAFFLFLTTVCGRAIPIIETGLLIFYFVAFFGVMGTIVHLSPHRDASFVFQTWNNGGGWSTQGVSFMVGMAGNAFSFLGADSVYHMSEEVKNATTVVPMAMLWSLTFNGVVGLAMFIAVLFCVGDLEEVLGTSYTFPFIQMLVQATGSTAGAAILLMVITIIDMALVMSTIVAASRMLWSFARDRGIPGWNWVRQVDPKTTIPARSILVTMTVSILLGLISIGSPVAFNDVVSLTVNSLYASYFTACALLLWRRVQGSILSPASSAAFISAETHHQHTLSEHKNLPGSAGKLVWGPWRMPEPLGTLVNFLACAYLLVVFVFTFFPPATPVQPATMNYSSLVMGVVAMASAVYYWVWGRRTYSGPVIEVDVGGL